MRKSFRQFLGVGEVDAFVNGVCIGLGSDQAEGTDERVGVHLVEFGEEGNRAAHAVGSGVVGVPSLPISDRAVDDGRLLL